MRHGAHSGRILLPLQYGGTAARLDLSLARTSKYDAAHPPSILPTSNNALRHPVLPVNQLDGANSICADGLGSMVVPYDPRAHSLGAWVAMHHALSSVDSSAGPTSRNPQDLSVGSLFAHAHTRTHTHVRPNSTGHLPSSVASQTSLLCGRFLGETARPGPNRQHTVILLVRQARGLRNDSARRILSPRLQSTGWCRAGPALYDSVGQGRYITVPSRDITVLWPFLFRRHNVNPDSRARRNCLGDLSLSLVCGRPTVRWTGRTAALKEASSTPQHSFRR